MKKIGAWLTRLNHHRWYKQVLAPRIPEVGVWFTESKEFKEWVLDPAAKLWVNGPGWYTFLDYCSLFIYHTLQPDQARPSTRAYPRMCC